MDTEPAPDAEPAYVVEPALLLADELLELDVTSVDRPEGDEPPPSAKGLDGGTLGPLVVNAASRTLGPIIRMIQLAVTRSAKRTARLTMDGECIELSNVPDEQRLRSIEAFLARHADA